MKTQLKLRCLLKIHVRANMRTHGYDEVGNRDPDFNL